MKIENVNLFVHIHVLLWTVLEGYITNYQVQVGALAPKGDNPT
jgi:hypothetical protein